MNESIGFIFEEGRKSDGTGYSIGSGVELDWEVTAGSCRLNCKGTIEGLWWYVKGNYHRAGLDKLRYIYGIFSFKRELRRK